MKRWVVVVATLLAMAAFPFGSHGVDHDPAAVAQPLTFEKLFGGNRWMRAGSSLYHCTGDYSQDGYMNLLFKFWK